MANKMLIDSSHPEETRVVVTRAGKVEEFDFESANRRQLRGNIYLAKVTRVEPSLQAAFVEYGGNRHGFLAFSEIHPDYYQIPVADRQALLEADEQEEREAEEREERRGGRRRRRSQRRHRSREETVSAPVEAGEAEPGEAFSVEEAELSVGEAPETAFQGESVESPALDAPQEEGPAGDDAAEAEAAASSGEQAPEHSAPDLVANVASHEEPELPPAEPAASQEEAPLELSPAQEEAFGEGNVERSEPVEFVAEFAEAVIVEDEAPEEAESRRDDRPAEEEDEDEDEEDEGEDEDDEDEDEHDEEDEDEQVEAVGGADALEEVPERRRTHRRQYKIQEVIKRRQILLVQVVKEERGNKGAALTTYLSMAGRYSVLMPNTGKGGGISRKITSAEDRKRLKEIVGELDVPEGMGIILRTAGASRTKQEIKRDYEYLMRLWESVRELTLESTAPALVYEEGSLIKRAIRDLYNKDIDDVIVAGEEGYREAKDFMSMIMPSQARAVRPYREPQALFAQFGVEAQLDAMFSNQVTLKSGGYLIINPTEALVSIDVNSGRATREHNIEDTALKTNLEAAEEIARQLRLRDLAGLIVIDFIDMEEKRNNRAVEKKLKECLKNDRARIQIGRISLFGLLEMSRQRIRTGVLESSSVPCRHCGGTGFVRAVPSVALQVLRSVEEALLRSCGHNLVVRTRTEVAFYILNQKRAHLSQIESRFGVAVMVAADESLAGTTTFSIERGTPAQALPRPTATGIRVDSITPVDEPIEVDPTAEFEREEEERQERPSAERASSPEQAEESDEGGEENGRRRRRRRRRRRDRDGDTARAEGADAAEDDAEEGDEEAAGLPENPAVEAAGQAEEESPAPAVSEPPPPAEAVLPEAGTAEPAEAAAPAEAAEPAPVEENPEPASSEAEPEAAPEPEPVAIVLTPPDPTRPKRGGWWSKAKSA
ncbi:Rne/Rng family ribonuclease [Enterovirga sp.]|uniref:Rne/Rng family ribonuclease n=1 Tax=Enterovirga sp. TaxID=2026350 RepID=UPI002BAD9EC3|nr:Rne/Rng family ribonuclease [Enterovirga sp.]HMO30137.1 Rne/Rng family ribonuclease [Enterovirga sp.]